MMPHLCVRTLRPGRLGTTMVGALLKLTRMHAFLLPAMALAVSLGATPARAEETERVILKLDEFLKLYDQSKADQAEEPPRDHAIASARYRGEVLFEEGKPYAARFRTTMRIRPFKSKGFARIPVLPATVAIESATIGGKEAPLVIDGSFYTLITDQRQEFDLELTFGAAVTSTEGASSLQFQLVPSGATELELSVPESEDLDFTVANAKLKTDKVVGSARVVEAAIAPTGLMSISWQRKAEATVKKQARVYSEIYTLASLGDGVARAAVSVKNTILFAGVDRFRYGLPEGMTVLEVQGGGVRDFSVENQQLTVNLGFAAEGAYELTLVMERPLSTGAAAMTVPILVPLEVERARGWVGVEARGNLELVGRQVREATPVDVRTLPAAILGVTEQPVLLGYKYLGAKPTIELVAAQHQGVDVLVTLLDQAEARTMWNREGRRLTSVRYWVRNNRRQFLKLALPKQAELWSASVAGRAVEPAKGDDGRIMIPLIRSQQAGQGLSAFTVEVVYVEKGTPVDARGRGTFQAELPAPDVPTTYVAWTVYSPERTRVRRRSIDGNLEHVEALSHPIEAPRAPSPIADADQAEEEQAAEQPMQQAMPAELPGKKTAAYAEAAVQQQAPPPPPPEPVSATGGLTAGATPVLVSLPLQGVETYFEKTLALGDAPRISFAYRGLRKRK